MEMVTQYSFFTTRMCRPSLVMGGDVEDFFPLNLGNNGNDFDVVLADISADGDAYRRSQTWRQTSRTASAFNSHGL